MNTELIEKVKDILIGIDEEETQNTNGWWVTSTGADFGSKKLNELLEFIKGFKQEENKKLLDYIYEFAWHYGRLFHTNQTNEERLKTISEKFMLPEQFLAQQYDNALTPQPKVSAEEIKGNAKNIYLKMVEEMPYNEPVSIKPYIIEAIEIGIKKGQTYAQQQSDAVEFLKWHSNNYFLAGSYEELYQQFLNREEGNNG